MDSDPHWVLLYYVCLVVSGRSIVVNYVAGIWEVDFGKIFLKRMNFIYIDVPKHSEVGIRYQIEFLDPNNLDFGEFGGQ